MNFKYGKVDGSRDKLWRARIQCMDDDDLEWRNHIVVYHKTKSKAIKLRRYVMSALHTENVLTDGPS